LRYVPHFPRLSENQPRLGFLTDQQYAKLAEECAKVGLWLRTLLALGASFGFRRGEMCALRVRQIDLLERIIGLDPGSTKNGEGREAGITEELAPLLAACVAGKASDDYVLTRDGRPIGDFRKTWKQVTLAAGVPGLLVHDLRRTAARNLRRLGEAEGVIMTIGGWKTRSVFERYNIKSRDDVRRATARLDEKHRARSAESADLAQIRHNPVFPTITAPAKLLN